MTPPRALPLSRDGLCPSAVRRPSVGVGLGPLCQAAVGRWPAVAGSAVGSVAGFGVDSVLNALGSWVADGRRLAARPDRRRCSSATTSIDLGAPWFPAHYATMAALAGVVVVPAAAARLIQAVYRQSASMLLRSVLVNVPLALLLTAVAVKLVQLGLAVTDAMAPRSPGARARRRPLPVLGRRRHCPPAGRQPGRPTFVLFLGALAVVVGAVLVWVELLIRAAAVYVAVALPPAGPGQPGLAGHRPLVPPPGRHPGRPGARPSSSSWRS